MTTIAELLSWGQETLSKAEAKMESQLLLAYVLECPRATLYTWPEQEVEEQKEAVFKALITKRLQGEPFAYLLGEREFWSLPFKVSVNTLIPRYDTEILVQQVLAHLPSTKQLVLELGTGCGVVGCVLAHERPTWEIIATDISAAALQIAQHNATNLGLHNIQFSCGSWFSGLPKLKQFAAIVSNPPYIQQDDPHLEEESLPFEPAVALVAGRTGYESFIAILEEAHFYLQANGLLAFEHGFEQAKGVQRLLEEKGFVQIQTFLDLSGHTRVTVGILP